MCQWFWGFADSPCPSDIRCACCSRLFSTQTGDDDSGKPGADSAAEVATLHFTPTSLSQKRSTRIALSICLVVIITMTVFLYCFFSLFFGMIERGPLRVTGDGNSTDIFPVLRRLRDYGIIENWGTFLLIQLVCVCVCMATRYTLCTIYCTIIDSTSMFWGSWGGRFCVGFVQCYMNLDRDNNIECRR